MISGWPNFRYVTVTNNFGGSKENIWKILMFVLMIVIYRFGKFLFPDEGNVCGNNFGVLMM
jgi:hypothetical protein